MFGLCHFCVGKAAFGSDECQHLRGERPRCDRGEWHAVGMRNQSGAAGRQFGEELLQRPRRRDLQKCVAATLFAGLDHHPLQPRLSRRRCLRHAAGCLQGHEPVHAEFRELLDQPLLSLSLWQRDSEREWDATWRRIDCRCVGLEFNPVAADQDHSGRPLTAAAVEELREFVDGAKAPGAPAEWAALAAKAEKQLIELDAAGAALQKINDDFADGLYTFNGIPANALVGGTPNYSVTVTPPAAFPTLTDTELDDLVSYVIHLSLRGETEFATMTRAR